MQQIRLNTSNQYLRNKWIATLVISNFSLDSSNQAVQFSLSPLEIRQNDFTLLDILRIEAKAVVQSIRPTPVGNIPLNTYDLSTKKSKRWVMYISESNIRAIEESRGIGDVPFKFDLDIQGLASVVLQNNAQGNKIQKSQFHWPLTLFGDTYMRIPKSDWISFLERCGNVSNLELEIPSYIKNDFSWNTAFKKLSQARSLLRQGYTHDALDACLSELESYIDQTERGGPYKGPTWTGILEGMPSQKQEALKGLFAGLATYLNKVGHHRDTKVLDSDETHPVIPVDHYEAELIVLMSQLVTTYIESIRLRK